MLLTARTPPENRLSAAGVALCVTEGACGRAPAIPRLPARDAPTLIDLPRHKPASKPQRQIEASYTLDSSCTLDSEEPHSAQLNDRSQVAVTASARL